MRKNKRAFTLLELLVALAIFSVTIVGVYSVFRAGLGGYQRLEASFEANQSAWAILGRIETDLKNTFVYNKETGSRFLGSGGSIEFLTTADVFMERKPQASICRVKYELGENVLKRLSLCGYDAVNESEFESGQDLSENVVALFFQYAATSNEESQPFTWQDVFPKADDPNQKNSLPLAIKIKLSVAQKDTNGKDYGPLEFEKVVGLEE